MTLHTLITGASSGLGAEFARQLAARGENLILTARRVDRLEALATELTAKHGVQVETIAADLADPAGPARLIDEVTARGLQIGTLINNAGLGQRGAFVELTEAAQLGTIDVDVRALVSLSHRALPAMIARGSGGILNVASSAAFQPGPWMAVYYASKAFVLSFSEALHEEVKAKGVRVVALCPGPVHTEFGAVSGMTDSILFQRLAGSAPAVVRDGLAALGSGRAVKVSGAMNAIGAASIRFTPRGVARRLVGALQKAR